MVPCTQKQAWETEDPTWNKCTSCDDTVDESKCYGKFNSEKGLTIKNVQQKKLVIEGRFV